MKRLYESVIANHITQHEQMLFLSGPRQVGKTTIVKHCHTITDYFKYLSWDKIRDREQILAGMEAVIEELPLHAALSQKPMIAFDEIHKYKHLPTFLKKFIF